MNVLCLYAIGYPLVAYLFMGSEKGGLIVQLFQATPIFALAYLWKYRYKTGNIRSYIDVWTISIVYFGFSAIFAALFYAKENQLIEISYAARFLSWFWLAATFKRVDLGPAFLERLSKCFWIGATIQCFLAVWGKVWGFQNGLASPYSNVEATTGSADVSGKAVVAFIVVWIALSVYWALVKRRMKMVYVAGVLGGIAVVLFSYNRASQLGLLVAYCVVVLACVRKKRFKAAVGLTVALATISSFILSNYGSQFTTRWQAVAYDGGSGRVEIIEIAARTLTSPPSSAVFWGGRGVFQMQEMMYEEIGSRIGMHNDLLDFAIVYGFVGAALCVWVLYSILNFRKATPRFSVENYFSTSTAVFAVLTGLFTGMFQSTYMYFMLISVQYYLASQARLKAYALERERIINEAIWEENEENIELLDNAQFNGFDDYNGEDDVDWDEGPQSWARRERFVANFD